MSIALWCLLAAALLHLVTKAPLAAAMAREGRGYDNHNPRDQQARLVGWGRRAKAVHDNQIESFPLFAAGVVVATSAAPASGAIDLLALAYVAARLLFMVLYLADQASLRSTVWTVGYLASVALIAAPLWAGP
ncbi:MAG: MAPEG family protein [Myxococcales bacterium]|nr:MAPEG family protein [Myxococcales bacterium]